MVQQPSISQLALFVAAMLVVSIANAAPQTPFSSNVPCAKDADCHISSAVEAFCVEDTCMYSANVSQHVEQLSVVSRLGAACRFDEECNVEGAVCAQNRCACGNSTSSSPSAPNTCTTTITAPTNALEDTCEDDAQCRGNRTACVDQRCECTGGYRQTANGGCEMLRGLGHACAPGIVCELPFAECGINRACVCQHNFFVHDQECLRANLTYLSPCATSVECAHSLGDAAACIEGRCHCSGHASFDKPVHACRADLVLPAHDDGAAGTSAGGRSIAPMILPGGAALFVFVTCLCLV